MIIENKVSNNGVEIYYLHHQGAKDKTPIVIIPGLTENAEDYKDLLLALDDRSGVAISLRGRGKSHAPDKGYTLEDHVSDVESVISALDYPSYALLGYSRGVSYTLQLALKYKPKVKGIMIGDYAPLHSKLPDGWVENFIGLPPWKGIASLERMPLHVFEGIQKESVEVLFFDDLKTLKCPVHVMHGGKKGSALSEPMRAVYKSSLENVSFENFENCGHNLFEPDASRFIQSVKAFLSLLDQGAD